MKKVYYIKYVWLLLAVWLMAACASDDAKLTGKWQLRSYQYADGTIEREDSVFYKFQTGSFLAIGLTNKNTYQSFFGNYSLKDGGISIILLPESAGYSYYDRFMGWPDCERTFKVLDLSRSSMTLEHEQVRYVFRKY